MSEQFRLGTNPSCRLRVRDTAAHRVEDVLGREIDESEHRVNKMQTPSADNLPNAPMILQPVDIKLA